MISFRSPVGSSRKAITCQLLIPSYTNRRSYAGIKQLYRHEFQQLASLSLLLPYLSRLDQASLNQPEQIKKFSALELRLLTTRLPDPLGE